MPRTARSQVTTLTRHAQDMKGLLSVRGQRSGGMTFLIRSTIHSGRLHKAKMMQT
jgi:hypothetical protein